MIDLKKYQGMIFLARKAGHVVIGLEKLKEQSKIYFVIIDSSLGRSSRREVEYLATKQHFEILETEVPVLGGVTFV